MKDKMMSEEEYLANYDDSRYPKPSVTADIVILAGNEILLIKRGNHPFMGKWATPGGFANKNEELVMTAKRELEEETGITGVSLSLVGVYSKPGRDPRGWVIS
ncbi:MAG TPA: NUDIX hydrolase, partial [Kandleria vitulina]|nr:NUDIX hydrolase [Kandleria vitulina]